jgi:hypothetical protein
MHFTEYADELYPFTCIEQVENMLLIDFVDDYP